MKKLISLTFMLTIFLWGVGYIDAHAQQNETKEKILKKYDLNKDGVLDSAEKEAMKKKIKAYMFFLENADYDDNKNGILEPEEEEVKDQDRLHQRKVIEEIVLKKRDLNKNGVLDPEEISKMKRDNKIFLDDQKAKVLRKYDTNKDGELDLDEKRVQWEEVKTLKEKALEKYDYDGDGTLNEAEKNYLKEDLKANKGQLK